MSLLKKMSNTTSGVARISCALGQEIFLRPLSTKATEFEVKTGAKLNDCKKCADTPLRPVLQGACSHLPPSALATPLTTT